MPETVMLLIAPSFYQWVSFFFFFFFFFFLNFLTRLNQKEIAVTLNLNCQSGNLNMTFFRQYCKPVHNSRVSLLAYTNRKLNFASSMSI